MGPEQAMKWTNLVAVLWIQACSGTNFDFSDYSSSLKQVLQIGQFQLNNLAVASDFGKALGWTAGYAMRRMPLWAVMLIASIIGLVGYGVQWLVITEKISAQYWQVYLLCLLAGNSICWLNTVGFILCIHYFPTRKAMALGISTSYNGLSAALYTLIVKAISLDNESLYLLLNAILPLIICSILCTFIRKLPSMEDSESESLRDGERFTFIILNIIAVVLGVYLLVNEFLNFKSTLFYRLYAIGMVLLLVAPLCIPGGIYIRDLRNNRDAAMGLQGDYPRISDDNSELAKHFLCSDEDRDLQENEMEFGDEIVPEGSAGEEDVADNNSDICNNIFTRIRSFWSHSQPSLGQEHNVPQLFSSVDFWLYFFMYFSGATLGLSYSNNLGQIAQSRGHSNATVFVSLYSSFAFFGRLMSAAPEYFPSVMRLRRPWWMCVALIPIPPSFFYLATGAAASLYVSTCILGMCSGYIISNGISLSAELFGINSFGVNHNIVIANIPFGSLLFGSMAALLYDDNAEGGEIQERKLGRMIVCMGGKCYRTTFIIWGCISLIGIILNSILVLRTRRLYEIRYKQEEEREVHCM